MKKVVVSGASGFIGSHTLNPLLEKGFEVHALSRQGVPLKQEENINWHKVDFLKTGEAERLLGKVKPTHFLHLAWDVTHGKYWESPSNLLWVDASEDWASQFANLGGQRWVTAGTCAEYNWNNQICREKDALAPATLYGRSKVNLNERLDSLFKDKVSNAWARLFFLYGPGESPKRLVPSVILSLIKGQGIKCSSGRQWRDFLFVEDAARAIVELLESDVQASINIGSGEKVTLRNVVEEIGEQLNGKDLIHFDLNDSEDPEFLIPDTSILFNEMGWKPNTGLKSGVSKTISWWKAQ